MLFAATLLVSALLLFCVEPMVAKMLLPLLGGVPAVWDTCLVFFQGALLLGYLFSLASLKLLGPRRQALLQASLIGAPLLVMPIVIDEHLAQRFSGHGPVWQALALLAVAAGLPFFALSTIAPTLQRWYSTTRGPGAKDPYFLYAASNLGSFVGLLLYPLLLEPRMGLGQQTLLLRAGYVVVAVLVIACALGMRRFADDAEPVPVAPLALSAPKVAVPRARWLFLSAVPSAYLVAVTSHLATDVTPAPLLWVLPLAVYLLSFVFVFATKPPLSHAFVARYSPLALLAVFYLCMVTQREPLTWIVLAHLVGFFAASLLCHGELARGRPAPERLNEFYVWVSLGGFLGGIAVAWVAPHVLPIKIEYPVCIVLALLARGTSLGARGWRTWLAPVGILGGTLAFAQLLARLHVSPDRGLALLMVVPVVVAFRARQRSVELAACLAALFVATLLLPGSFFGPTLFRARNFFGLVRVMRYADEGYTELVDGTTTHGAQALDAKQRREPTTYYARSGPAGDLFAAYGAQPNLPRRVAVIGLGTGTLAAYAQPQEQWTFFEINPAVVRIARDPSLFTYLSDAFPKREGLQVVVGDARLELASQPGNYGLLLIDAFSSDAIPVHLVTQEALALYARQLAPSGLIAWHISNRYVDLGPVLVELAASQGFTCLRRADSTSTQQQAHDAHMISVWAVMSRDPTTLARLPSTWRPIPRRKNFRAWTDDQSSIVPAFRL